MTPFFFGPLEEQLFGCYHEPGDGADRDTGVVLCAPTVPEYGRSHRAMRQLAVLLSRAGLPVLQFDYFGMGDSAGGLDDTDLVHWKRDIATAIAELRRRSGCAHTTLAGLRFGATLAAMAGAELSGIQQLVLWEPLLDGEAYLEQIRHLAESPLVRVAGEAGEKELMGISLELPIVTDLHAVDLLGFARRPAERVLLLSSTPGGEPDSFLRHLQQLGAEVDHRHIPDSEVWRDDEQALVPARAIRAIVAWIKSEA